jgi:hypothetical protein
MTPDFAVELVNFMPPTTTFTVRPAVEFICTIEGQVRGMFSYATGASISYGENWYNSNISFGANKSLLIKTSAGSGGTILNKVDPIAKTIKSIGNMANMEYNDDCVLYKHTMFFASGSPSSAMYLYDEAKGLAKFALEIGADGAEEIGDMFSLVFYKKYLFMAGYSGLNLYFIEAQYADVVNPVNSAFWRFIENIFSPHFGQTFTLDGTVQMGGRILKMFQLSRSGADTVNSYLAVVTDMGEVVLFEGDDPTDETGEKWKVAGKYKIPPPLNRNSFCDMEGDYIVATQNGLVSLRRVIFGQTTEITQNLEYRLMSLFSQYMFTMPIYSQFIGLYYHSRSRLLIFNVPYALPMPFNKVIAGYQLFADQQLSFPFDTYSPIQQWATLPEDTIKRITSFVTDFCVRNYVDYKIIIEFDGNYNAGGIFLTTTATLGAMTLDKVQPATIVVDLKIKESAGTAAKSLLKNPIQYTVADLNAADRKAELVSGNIPAWNGAMYNSQDNTVRYKLSKDFTITNILTSTTNFYYGTSFRGLYRYDTFPVAYNKDACFGIELSPLFDNGVNSNITWQSIANRKDTINGGFIWWFSDEWQGINTGLKVGDVTYDNCLDWHKVVIKSLCKMGARELFPYDSILPDSEIEFRWYAPIKVDGVTQVNNLIVLKAKLWSGKPALNSGTITYKLTITEEISTKGQGWHYDKRDYYVQCWGTGLFVCFSVTDTARPDDFFDLPVAATTDCDTEAAFIRMNSEQDHISFTGWGSSQPTWIGNPSASFTTEIWIPQTREEMGVAPDFNSMKWYFSNARFELINDLASNPASLNNVDLSLVPIFDNIDIKSDYRSTQYVFDSHFGTWSSFKDVNMSHGIEHDNDFYFVSPLDVQYGENDGVMVDNSRLCKFNPAQLGDDADDSNFRVPINVSYKTVPTFDLGKPSKKIFKRLKVFGNPSVFWQPPRAGIEERPFVITPYSDFKEGYRTGFVHAYDGQSVSMKLLAKHFKSRMAHELTPQEKKKFWELYKEANDMVSQIEIPIIAHIGTRFGLEIDMKLVEAYMNIYGFEVLFEETKQLI